MGQVIDKLLSVIPDKTYIKLKYFYFFHKFPNIDNPKTYNEKLQWVKLYDRNPLYTKLSDKYEVKEYIKNIIGENYIIPTLGLYDSFEDIDFDCLPQQFVLKCTHDSGGLVIVKDKNKINFEEVKKSINSSLKNNYYFHSREWPYKDIKPRIIAEKYMEDDTGDLKDYKFFCFDGEVKMLFVASERQNKSVETKFDFFDDEFNHLPIINHHPNSDKPIKKPNNFEEMKDIARKLSKGFKHIRIDLYSINNKVYFGEMTFFHYSGFQPFEPGEWDYTLGNWFKL